MEIKNIKRSGDGFVVKYVSNGIQHKIRFNNESEFNQWKKVENYAFNMSVIVVSLVIVSISIIMVFVSLLFNLYQIK